MPTSQQCTSGVTAGRRVVGYRHGLRMVSPSQLVRRGREDGKMIAILCWPPGAGEAERFSGREPEPTRSVHLIGPGKLRDGRETVPLRVS